MSKEATALVVTTDKKSENKAELLIKPTRSDLINLILREAREDHRKQVRGAGEEASLAREELAALIKAETIAKHSEGLESLRKMVKAEPVKDWSFGERDSYYYTPPAGHIGVKVEQCGNRRDSRINIILTIKESAKIKAAIKKVEEAKEHQESFYDGTMSDTDARAIIRDRLLKKSIEKSPGGQDLLKALRNFRQDLEKETGKNILRG